MQPGCTLRSWLDLEWQTRGTWHGAALPHLRGLTHSRMYTCYAYI